MLLKTLLVATLVATVASSHEEGRRRRYPDPFAALDHHLSHSLSFHYLWPWSELFQAAAALDSEKTIEDEEAEIIPDPNKFEIHLKLRNFKPNELKVKVEHRHVTVEGKHMVTNNHNKQHVANYFMQQFALPAGTKPEEVTAVYSEKGVLTVSAPKHELPPPPPARDVPIEVKLPETKPDEEKIEDISSEESNEEVTTPKATQETNETVLKPIAEAIDTPVKKVEEDLAEATTHVNKIRKKELKSSASQSTRDNEVTKGVDGNGLDYALIEE